MSINKEQLQSLILRTLTELQEATNGKIQVNDESVDLLLMTAAHESKLGEFIKQQGGPALGIFQMEPATHEDHWEYITPREWLYRALSYMNLETDTNASTMEYNLKYAIVLARIHYYRRPEALPKKTERYRGIGGTEEYLGNLAVYCKKYYNTSAGKATALKYLNDYNRLILDIR